MSNNFPKSNDGFQARPSQPKRVRQEIKEYRTGTISRQTGKNNPQVLKKLNED